MDEGKEYSDDDEIIFSNNKKRRRASVLNSSSSSSSSSDNDDVADDVEERECKAKRQKRGTLKKEFASTGFQDLIAKKSIQQSLINQIPKKHRHATFIALRLVCKSANDMLKEYLEKETVLKLNFAVIPKKNKKENSDSLKSVVGTIPENYEKFSVKPNALSISTSSNFEEIQTFIAINGTRCTQLSLYQHIGKMNIFDIKAVLRNTPNIVKLYLFAYGLCGVRFGINADDTDTAGIGGGGVMLPYLKDLYIEDASRMGIHSRWEILDHAAMALLLKWCPAINLLFCSKRICDFEKQSAIQKYYGEFCGIDFKKRVVESHDCMTEFCKFECIRRHKSGDYASEFRNYWESEGQRRLSKYKHHKKYDYLEGIGEVRSSYDYTDSSPSSSSLSSSSSTEEIDAVIDKEAGRNIDKDIYEAENPVDDDDDEEEEDGDDDNDSERLLDKEASEGEDTEEEEQEEEVEEDDGQAQTDDCDSSSDLEEVHLHSDSDNDSIEFSQEEVDCSSTSSSPRSVTSLKWENKSGSESDFF